MDAPVSRREQKKAEVREALVEAADALFVEHGFEGTTVDQIAERAGVSRRTFFRYFSSKEAIAFPRSQDRLAGFSILLRDRFAQEPPLRAVHGACLEVARTLVGRADEELARHKVIDASATLLAAELEVYRQWERAIAEAVSTNATDPERLRLGRLFAAAVMGAMRSVVRSWFDADGKMDLVEFVDEAFNVLESGFSGKL